MAKNKAQSNKSKSATLKEKEPSKHNIYNPIKVSTTPIQIFMLHLFLKNKPIIGTNRIQQAVKNPAFPAEAPIYKPSC